MICGQELVIIRNLNLINILFFDEGEYPDENGKPNKCKRSFESMLRHQNLCDFIDILEITKKYLYGEAS